MAIPTKAGHDGGSVVRFAMFAAAALAACGRVGFDPRGGENATEPDGGGTSPGEDGGSDAASAGSFGTMEVGISSQNSGSDRVWISRFALTDPAVVHTLTAHIAPVGAQATSLRGVIYADASGGPTTLLGTTTEVALPGSAIPGWVALPLATPPSLPPGTYWLGLHTSTQASIQYRSAAGATKFAGDIYGDGTDATYAGSATTFTMELSIYAEYTR